MIPCDRCCAWARHTWLHRHTGRMLRLCTHHSREHQLGLYDRGFLLVEALSILAPIGR